MKRLAFFAFYIAFFCSCSNTSSDDFIQNYQGKWQLIQMSGSTPNSATSGAEMFWQEFYQLNSDGTFLKNRQREDITKEATGRFKVVIIEKEKYLEFVFDLENDLVGSCSGPFKEYMIIESRKSFYSTWNACDGPGLNYELVD